MVRKCAVGCCKNGALFICAQVVVMIRSSACCGLHQRAAELHLTFLDVRNGTLQMIIRRDLRDDHQEVESAVVEVLRAAGRRRGQPAAGLSAQSLHVCRFHQGSHPVSLSLPHAFCLSSVSRVRAQQPPPFYSPQRPERFPDMRVEL